MIAFYVNPFHRRWIIARLRAPSKLIAFARRFGHDVGVEIERGLRAWSPELVEQVRGWLAQVQYMPDEFRDRLVREAREIFEVRIAAPLSTLDLSTGGDRSTMFADALPIVETSACTCPGIMRTGCPCGRCHGAGFSHEMTGSDEDGTTDFVEIYCACADGDRLRVRDVGVVRCVNCGGGTCLCEQLATGHA